MEDGARPRGRRDAIAVVWVAGRQRGAGAPIGCATARGGRAQDVQGGEAGGRKAEWRRSRGSRAQMFAAELDPVIEVG